MTSGHIHKLRKVYFVSSALGISIEIFGRLLTVSWQNNHRKESQVTFDEVYKACQEIAPGQEKTFQMDSDPNDFSAARLITALYTEGHGTFHVTISGREINVSRT